MIKVELRGRLGNQMFQYSILRVISEIKGYEYSFNENWLGKNIFDIDYGVKNNHNNFNVFDEGLNKFNKKVFDIKDNTLLKGYWQSDKYYKYNEDFVRSIFKIKDNIKNNVDYSILKNDTCLIHFRGGDYLNANYIPSKQWYERSKKHILDNYDINNFKVITDDLRLAKSYFKEDEIIKNDMNTDFCLLNRSKTNIISSSSFSWWATWLNNNSNVIIAPDKWLNHNNIKGTNGFYPFDIETKRMLYIPKN
jgi:hypothetical protein